MMNISRLLAAICITTVILVANCERSLACGAPAANWTSSPPAWLSRPWTADDRPFETVRLEILDQFNRKAITHADVVRLRAQAERTPCEAMALFRWGWTAVLYDRQRLADLLSPELEDLDTFALDRPMTAGPGQPNPVPSFNYVRLRIVVRAEWAGADSSWNAVIDRALKIRDDEYVLAESKVFSLAGSRSELVRNSAVGRQLEVARRFKFVGTAKYFRLLFGIYISECKSSGFQRGFKEAVYFGNRYFQLADPRDLALPRLKLNIPYLTKFHALALAKMAAKAKVESHARAIHRPHRR